MGKPILTLEQAKELLPEVKTILERLMHLNKTLSILSSMEISYEDEYDEMKADLATNKELHRLSVKLFEGFSKLLDIGCVVKDLEDGLVDFYGKFENRTIFFCWKIGEDDIENWHETDDGYEERKPILELVEKRSQS